MSSTNPSSPLIPLAEQRLARLTLRRLAQPPATGKGRLIYLVGPAGCGKSALLQESFGNQATSQVPLLSLTASEFAAQLADASEHQTIPEFQQQFRSVSVLICEDLQALGARMETQQQLLAILDEILAHGGLVVVSSTQLPGQLDSFSSKLVSRFRGGTILTIENPGPDSRLELLRLFARQRQVPISRDALLLLANSVAGSPRELAGIVTQLAEARRPIKLADIDEFVQRQLPNRNITPVRILRAVAREFGLSVTALQSSRRSQALVLPRQVAMWLSRKLCQASYPELGELFQRRHSSVLHAVRKLESRLVRDPSLRQRLVRLEAACR